MKGCFQDLCGAIIVCLCFLLQGVWVLEAQGLLTYFSAVLLILFSWLLACAFYWLRRFNAIKSSLFSLSAGGLGMLIGSTFDGGYQVVMHFSHGFFMIPTWMTLFMVLACLMLCCFFCRIPGFCLGQNIKLHCLAVIPMVMGMILPHFLNISLIHSSSWMFVERHLLTLLGMSIGVLSGVIVMRRLMEKEWALKIRFSYGDY